MAKKGNFRVFLEGLYVSLLNFFKNKFTKEQILKTLEEKAVKSVLKKLLIVGGWKAWVVKFVVGELIEEADEHLIEPAFRKIGFIKDSLEGKAIYKKVQNAKDVDDWRDTIGDV